MHGQGTVGTVYTQLPMVLGVASRTGGARLRLRDCDCDGLTWISGSVYEYARRDDEREHER